MSLQTNVDTFINWIKRSGLDVKPHQLSGIRWCLSREHNNKPLHLTSTSHFDIDDTNKGVYIPPIAGGILGDEMGLGKTILMIGAIIANPKKSTLIVLPNCLVKQWTNVLNKLLTDDFPIPGSPVRMTTPGEFKIPHICSTSDFLPNSVGPFRDCCLAPRNR